MERKTLVLFALAGTVVCSVFVQRTGHVGRWLTGNYGDQKGSQAQHINSQEAIKNSCRTLCQIFPFIIATAGEAQQCSPVETDSKICLVLLAAWQQGVTGILPETGITCFLDIFWTISTFTRHKTAEG